MIETVVYSKKYRVAGRLDRVGYLQDDLSVVDIKSGSSIAFTTCLQTAAYQNLFNEHAGSCEFDEQTHVYKDKDGVVPSVTTVINDNSFVDKTCIPQQFIIAAGNFGKAVHLACEYDDKHVLDYSKLDNKISPYVRAWMRFKIDCHYEDYKPNKLKDKIKRRFAVLLKPDGTYKLEEYKNKADWQVFLACLTLYNFRRRS